MLLNISLYNVLNNQINLIDLSMNIKTYNINKL